jgi:glutamate/tyrosine decarboxylase-like PLP-dependent enzyme
LQALADALQEEPCDPSSVLALLDEYGSPATVASAGGRYFGFVTGGTLPVALAANWLAGAWDQNAGLWVQSPVAAFLEEVTAGWLRDIFRFPSSCGVGFVTGATMANFSCLAAARHALLKHAGWNVEEQGLFGAPELTVVVGNEVHASVLKALSLVGLGRNRVLRVSADEQARKSPSSCWISQRLDSVA